ncbi:taste receptor type 2 member 46-like [Saccopteryx bilineata]|uniref:taste receptor type 2 member 46-like n=1 Tax=Saccopteryx bilineata TaxID=59482 RepID=UPI00338EB267
MISSILSILFILIIGEFVLGNFFNGFIALVNCIDWMKTQKISCTDQILTALAASRIGLLWTTGLHWYGTLINPAYHSPEVRTIAYIAWEVSSHFSVWLATSLCILYLLKIANFSSPFFLHLKWKAERVVLMILLGSFVFLVCHVAVVSIDEKVYMNEYKGNFTWEANFMDMVHLSNITIFILANFISFTMSMTAFLLLIFSLWKHLRKMQLSGKGSQDPSTKVHIRALQSVISFLFLSVIYFVTQITLTWNSNTLKNRSVFMLCQVLTVLYASSHSFILIWGNKKLRQAFLSFLWQLRCW